LTDSDAMNTPSPVSIALRRHQGRRDQGVPTVTALVGPVGLGVREWRKWAGTEGRPCVVSSETDPDDALAAWVESIFAVARPADRACAWLASVTGRAAEAMSVEVGRMTPHDLDRLARKLPTDLREPVAVAAFLVLRDHATGVRTDPRRFTRELVGAEREAGVVRAVAGLYPLESRPALLFAAPRAADGWGLAAARALERVAVAEPRLPVALAIGADDYARLAAAYPDARATALLREGFVELRGVAGNELDERLRAAGVELPAATADRLASEGLAEEVATAFVGAARAVQHPGPADLESDFRSIHEEFLFELLESMPQTAGLFRPNAPPGFRHGHLSAETDLLADALKLAVEVDGEHYHLTPEQYRRDRRKDWLYQRHGYLVLRFLAEDVVGDPELVLDTILEAVALRRASARPTGAA
jgi:hypothetical protein